MSPTDEAFDDVQFLTGSPHRPVILDAMSTDPVRPGKLTERVDATRTTVQRVLAGFLDRQWVAKRDGEYYATVTGKRVHARYESLVDEIGRAQALGPMATHLEFPLEDVPDEALATGSVTVATEQNPLAVIEGIVEWFQDRDGGHVAGVTPIVSQTINEAAAEMVDDGTSVDLVIDPNVLEHSAAEFPSATDRAVDDEGVDAFVYPEPVSYGLAVHGTDVMLAAYDDESNPRALLECDDADVADWAEDRVDRLLSRATPLAEALSDDA